LNLSYKNFAKKTYEFTHELEAGEKVFALEFNPVKTRLDNMLQPGAVVRATLNTL